MARTASILSRFLGRGAARPSAATRLAARGARIIRAAVDAARTTDQNRRHWANADGLGPNAALSPEVRRIVRERARYEASNNGYAKGIVRTQANDVVGTGPRLQLLTEDGALNTEVERRFHEWAQATSLARKLRLMQGAKIIDGEAFALLRTNAGVGHPVLLDLQPIEADRVCSPLGISTDAREVDGIRFDADGNPTSYRVLDQHPGESFQAMPRHTEVPASGMIHLFRADRPEQRRGLSELAPSLPLFAQLRRFTLAVLAAAETAARFAGVLQSDAPADGAEDIDPLDVIELEPNMLTTMPAGWKLGQIQAQQPTTTYAQFKVEVLSEAARPLSMPRNIATGDSSQYNYASGRLDHQTYRKAIGIERQELEEVVLDRILRDWIREARISLDLPGLGADSMLVPHKWFWPGHEHVDPNKEANAQAVRLGSLTTTLADEYARQGQDWEMQLRQRAKEQALMRRLGLVAGEPPTSEPEDADETEQIEEAAHVA